MWRFLKNSCVALVVGVFSITVPVVSSHAHADEAANFMLTGVIVDSISICSFGCANGVANVTFTVADQVTQLCDSGASISFPLVQGSYGSQTAIPQAKLFLSMLVMSKINKQPLQVWFSNYTATNPVTMPQVQRYCQGSLQHLGLDSTSPSVAGLVN